MVNIKLRSMSQDKRRTLLLLGAGLLALILLAAGLPRLELGPGQPLPLPAALPQRDAGPGLERPLLDFFGLLLALLFWVIIPLAIIVALFRPELRKVLLMTLLRSAVLLLLFMFLLRYLRPLEPEPHSAEPEVLGIPEFAPSPERPLQIPDFVSDPPQWFAVAAVAALGAILIGVAWLRWRQLRRPDPSRSLAAEAGAALDGLRAGASLKSTVMRCYLEMTRILEAQGLRREEAMTPREFGRHLERLGWQDEHIHRLTRLFEAVRYGASAPGAREEREAEACLSAIVESYGRPS